MPQIGEIRHGQTESVQWDGGRWVPIGGSTSSTSSNSPSLLDYIPGVRDVVNLPSNLVKGVSAIPGVVSGLANNPSATVKGFVQGASDAATPDRVGLLSLLLGGAGLPAVLAAGGGEAGAKIGQAVTDSPNKPKTFGDAATQVGEAAAVPAIPATFNKATQVVKSAVPSVSGTGLTGAAIGGYEGYKRGGLLGGAEGAVTGYYLGNKASKLEQILGALKDKEGTSAATEAQIAADAPPETESTAQETMRKAKGVEIPTEPTGGWGSSNITAPAQSYAPGNTSEGVQRGLADVRAAQAPRAIRQEAANPSYSRPSVPYSTEAVDYLQSTTPEPPGGWDAWNAANVIGRDRTTGSAASFTDVANRFRLAQQGLSGQ